MSVVRNVGVRKAGLRYVDVDLAAFEGDAKAGLGDLDLEVARLVLAVHGYGDVHVLDRLRPLVRQRGLLGVFLGLGLPVGAFAL